MSKKDDYQAGRHDGRNGFARHSNNRDYHYGYNAGKQEYDFWNDKSLYPDLDYDSDQPDSSSHNSSSPHQSYPSNTKISGSSVFLVIFIWIFLFAPFAFFCTWQDTIVQIIFWGGIVIFVLVFLLWLYGAIEEYHEKQK